jgi:hypothetical protein
MGHAIRSKQLIRAGQVAAVPELIDKARSDFGEALRRLIHPRLGGADAGYSAVMRQAVL